MIAVVCIPLSQAPEAKPVLARWFLAEWPEHYAGRSVAEVEADFAAPDDGGLPYIIAAFRGSTLCGTAALRETSILTFQGLTPWLGGLYVHPSQRRTGVARSMIAEIEAEAVRRGSSSLYAGTVAS